MRTRKLVAALAATATLFTACGTVQQPDTQSITVEQPPQTTTTTTQPPPPQPEVAPATGYAVTLRHETALPGGTYPAGTVFHSGHMTSTTVTVTLPDKAETETVLPLPQVDVAALPYIVHIDLQNRFLTVTNIDGQPVLTSPVGIGHPDTPTPTGQFYITELLQPANPDGPYGAYAFGTSAHSQVLTEFAGTDQAIIGLHGTNNPNSVGDAVSNGCLRLPDDTVTGLVGLLPLGTRVEIS